MHRAKYRRRTCLLAAAALILSGCHPSKPPPPAKLFLFTATTLQNNLGGNVTEAFGIDDHGQIAGRTAAPKSAGGHSHAVLWAGGSVRDLGTLDDGGSEADIITSDNAIYGWSSSKKIHIHGVVFQEGGPKDLGVLNGASSQVDAAASNGRYVMTIQEIAGATKAYLYGGKKPINLGLLTGFRTAMASAMNDTGFITGTDRSDAGLERAFIWHNGNLIPLMPPPGFLDTFGNAINAQGEVAGSASIGASRSRAVVWLNGKPTILPSGKGKDAEAHSINDAGDVVGSVHGHACLWRRVKNSYASPIDLNTETDKPPDTDLSNAVAINNRDEIICNTSPAHGIRAYLLRRTR